MYRVLIAKKVYSKQKWNRYLGINHESKRTRIMNGHGQHFAKIVVFLQYTRYVVSMYVAHTMDLHICTWLEGILWMYIFTNLEVRFLVVRWLMVRESVITSPVSIYGNYKSEFSCTLWYDDFWMSGRPMAIIFRLFPWEIEKVDRIEIQSH